MAKKIKTETAEQKLERLMVRIILTEPFFAILLLKLKRKPVPNIPTAGTDGVDLIYNPEWIESLPDQDAHFILLHEIMHCVMNHTSRRGNRDPQLFNIACDHAINLELIKAGYKMPKEGLADPLYRDMSAEQIYAKLRDEQNNKPKPQPDPSGNPEAGDEQADGSGEASGQEGEGEGKDQANNPCPDPGKCGGVMDAPATQEGASELAEHEAQWQQAVQQAAQIAKAQGKLPGGFERMLSEVLKPVVDWKDVLRDFMTQNSKDDYSWLRANRRFIAQNIYLPSLYSDGNMDFFGIGVDTSGSMNDADMNAFAAEISNILEDLASDRAEIIYCDAAVGKRQTVTKNDLPLQLKPVGGGGTNFSPVMDELKKLEDDPACLVYFTDGFCNSFGDRPECPVLWVITSDGNRSFKPPFGRVIQMAAQS